MQKKLKIQIPLVEDFRDYLKREPRMQMIDPPANKLDFQIELPNLRLPFPIAQQSNSLKTLKLSPMVSLPLAITFGEHIQLLHSKLPPRGLNRPKISVSQDLELEKVSKNIQEAKRQPKLQFRINPSEVAKD